MNYTSTTKGRGIELDVFYLKFDIFDINKLYNNKNLWLGNPPRLVLCINVLLFFNR